MTTFKAGDPIGQCANQKCGGSVLYDGGKTATCQGCAATYDVDFEDGEEVVEEPVAEQAPVAPETPAPDPLPVALTDPPPAPVQPAARPVAQPVEVAAPPRPLVVEPEEPVLNTPPVGATQIGAGVIGIDGPVTPQPVQPVIDGEAIGKLTKLVSGTPEVRKQELSLDPAQVEATAGAAKVDVPKYVKDSRPWKWGQRMGNSGNPYREGSKSWMLFNMFEGDGCTPEEAILECGKVPELVEKMSYILTMHDVISQGIASGLLLMDPTTRKITVCKGLPQAAQMP